MQNIKQLERNRNPYFDFLRGVAIIMVVGQHTGGVANFSIDSGFNLNILIMQLIKVAVPVFLAISGYFLCNARINNGKEYRAFLKKHLLRIYIPLYIFSLPYIFLNGFVLKSVAGRTILTLVGYHSVYYFVFLIAQYYVLLPIIRRLMKSRVTGLVVCGLITAVTIVASTYYRIILGHTVPLYLYAGPFPMWLIFFAMGCWFSIHGCRYGLIVPTILAVLSLCMAYVESVYLTSHFHTDGFGLKPSVYIYSAFALVVLFSAKLQNYYNIKCAKSLWGVERLGRLSFTIYLGHMYVFHAFEGRHWLTDAWIVNWLVIILLSSAGALVLEWVIPRKLQRYVGL